MLNLGVDAATASMFIARTCSLSLITDEHTATLHALVDNINRVVALTNEQMGGPKVDQETVSKRPMNILFLPGIVISFDLIVHVGHGLDYFTSSVSKSMAERAEAKELYQRIIEFKRAGPGLKDHSSHRVSIRPLSESGTDLMAKIAAAGAEAEDNPAQAVQQEPSVTVDRRYYCSR